MKKPNDEYAYRKKLDPHRNCCEDMDNVGCGCLFILLVIMAIIGLVMHHC